MKPIIAPSILSADFGYLAKDIEMVNRSDSITFGLSAINIPSFGLALFKS